MLLIIRAMLGEASFFVQSDLLDFARSLATNIVRVWFGYALWSGAS